MSFRLRLLTAMAAIFAASTAFAHASTITEILSFTATGAAAASGSYTITFDPTLTYTNDSVDLTVDSFSDSAISSPVPAGFNYDGAGTLTIGGLVNGVISVAKGTNDYFLFMESANTASPVFVDFNATSASSPSTFFPDLSGTVTVSAASEPSSLAMFGTGILGLTGVVRRRLTRAA